MEAAEDHRAAAVALHEEEAPQRPGEVQGLAHLLADQIGQLRVAARRRQRHLHEMGVEITSGTLSQ